MLMTHITAMGVENPYQFCVPTTIMRYTNPRLLYLLYLLLYYFTTFSYQKIGTINQHENTECAICYRKLIPETFGTKFHVRRVKNRYRFLASISVKYVMGIRGNF